MIETTLKDLTQAIRDLTVALNSRTTTTVVVPQPEPVSVTNAEPVRAPVIIPAPAPVAAADVDVVIPSKAVTQADLRDAASRLLMAKRLPDILAINKEFGIKRITECPEDKYEAVYEALNKALNAPGS